MPGINWGTAPGWVGAQNNSQQQKNAGYSDWVKQVLAALVQQGHQVGETWWQNQGGGIDPLDGGPFVAPSQAFATVNGKQFLLPTLNYSAWRKSGGDPTASFTHSWNAPGGSPDPGAAYQNSLNFGNPGQVDDRASSMDYLKQYMTKEAAPQGAGGAGDGLERGYGTPGVAPGIPAPPDYTKTREAGLGPTPYDQAQQRFASMTPEQQQWGVTAAQNEQQGFPGNYNNSGYGTPDAPLGGYDPGLQDPARGLGSASLLRGRRVGAYAPQPVQPVRPGSAMLLRTGQRR